MIYVTYIYGIISPQLHLFRLLRYLVQAAVCVRCLALPLESHNHKAHEDVDHEEGKDDDVDKVEHEDNWTIAFFWSNISLIGINRNIKNPETNILCIFFLN